MSHIAHRHRIPWLRTPQLVPPGAVEIDWSHPLAQAVSAYWLLNGDTRDLTGQSPITSIVAPAGFGATSRGTALVAPNGGHATIQNSPALAFSGNVTILCTINFAAWGGYQALYNKTSGSSGAPFDWWITNAESVFYVGGSAVHGVVPALGAPHQLGVTISGSLTSGTVTHYSDGASAASGTWGPTSWSNAGVPLIGSRDDGGTQLNGTISNVVLWNRTLSAAEMAWLAAEPFAMLRPAFVPRRRGPLSTPAALRQAVVFAIT